jgi:Transposase IS4
MSSDNNLPVENIDNHIGVSVSGLSEAETMSELSSPTIGNTVFTTTTTPTTLQTTETTERRSKTTETNNQTASIVGIEVTEEAEERLGSPSAILVNLPTTPELPSRMTMSEADYEKLQDDGYDSDGVCQAMLLLNQEEEEAIEEEAVLPEEGQQVFLQVQEEETQEEDAEKVDAMQQEPFGISETALATMSFLAIKHELKCRGVKNLSKKTKGELLELLRESLAQNDQTENSNQQRNKQNKKTAKKDELSGFATAAYWRQLVPLTDPVPDPLNGTHFHSPTVSEGDICAEPTRKHNYEETFDRMPFVGKIHVPTILKSRKVKLGKDRKVQYKEMVSSEGAPKHNFIKNNNLTLDSTPQEWFRAFLPNSRKKTANESDAKKFHTDLWCTYTNIKATMANAGTESFYPDYKPFTPREIEKHLALYFFNGLLPSPQVEMKLKSQSQDCLQGNDFVWRAMGKNAKSRHRHFKAFFCVQNPITPPPSKKVNPLHKVNSFLKWIQQVSQAAWKLGRDLSGDEQTIGFQGNHADKRRITYKAEGDGFQCDALCDNGYTYNFYFRNMPPPPKYINMGWSPLHARMLSLFDALEEPYHRVWMDNLYLSAKFCKGCFKHDNKVLLAGVTRKSGRGFPLSVLQEEVKNKNELLKVRGTVKAAVLDGDIECPNLLAVSVYDTKPVHFLTMNAEEIKWIECTKKVFSTETQRIETMKFLRLNINVDYNNKMNSVDNSDQLRQNYRFDHWMRKRKWWWSIFFWGIGVLMVNAYICYVRFHLMHNKKKKDLLTHYEFREQIIKAWLEPETYWLDHKTETQSNKKRKHSLFTTSSSSIDASMQTRQQTQVMQQAGDGKRAPKMTDESLDQVDGTLACRLQHNLPHWTQPKRTKRSKCCMHYWASGIEDRGQIVRCATCKVHLCTSCFEGFHTIEDLVAEKEKLGRQMTECKKSKS